MGIILWVVFGALVGWIASIIMGRNRSMGALANIAVGILGAGLGGWLSSALFGMQGVTGFNLGSLLIAIAGSCILLLIFSFFRRASSSNDH
ncbi:MAG TPA: GlsB/YeaQ/YmgE family stress response membrane protein [Clostridia bacterium]|nr:GlsB/YeaQ/YmgE family stress response membrane protein [Clostridia bacterium]